MCLALTTASDATIEAILKEPAKVWLLVSPDDLDFYWEDAGKAPQAGAADSGGGLLGKIKSMFEAKHKAAAEPDAAPEGNGHEILGLDPARGEGVEDDLDKAWHGLHYIFTGTADGGAAPLNFLVSGGVETGKIEIGYGVPRAFTSADTAKIFDALSKWTEHKVREKYDAEDMMSLDIYPSIWDRPGAEGEDPEGLEYLVENFDRLKEFIANAHKSGVGFVITIQ